tara:strand:- start:383 stop:496 length:114 start_codon:yes stop_codon:yes gene_type:complete
MKLVVVIIVLNIVFIAHFAGEKDVAVRNVASEQFELK